MQIGGLSCPIGNRELLQTCNQVVYGDVNGKLCFGGKFSVCYMQYGIFDMKYAISIYILQADLFQNNIVELPW
jgi:hypothetical protein